ncbi:MAG: RNA polymerase sigma factor [Candidatus Rifleibacteriota bacterium]
MTINNEKISDKHYVDETLSGQTEAFRPIVEKYWNLVFSVISKYIKNKETIADLCQEVFFKSFKKLDQFKTQQNFAPWLTKIAVNHTIEYLRKEKRNNFIEFDIERAACCKLEPNSVLDQNQLFDECLNRLSPEFQIMFILRHGVDFSYEDIAFVMDVPIGTIKASLFRIRNQLRKSFVSSQNRKQTLAAKGNANG